MNGEYNEFPELFTTIPFKPLPDLRWTRIPSAENMKEIQVGIDEVILKVKYADVISEISNKIDFTQLTTAAYIKQQFGSFVALRGYLNMVHRTFDQQVGNEDDSGTQTKPTASMAVEFML